MRFPDVMNLDISDIMLKRATTAIACTFHTICSKSVGYPSADGYWSFNSINTSDFIISFVEKSKCSLSSLLLAMIYIDRLCCGKKVILSHHTSRRLFAVALLCAVKYWEDSFYSNFYFANASGLCLEELNGLESQFLFALEFDLNVQPEDFLQYYNSFSRQFKKDSFQPEVHDLQKLYSHPCSPSPLTYPCSPPPLVSPCTSDEDITQPFPPLDKFFYTQDKKETKRTRTWDYNQDDSIYCKKPKLAHTIKFTDPYIWNELDIPPITESCVT